MGKRKNEDAGDESRSVAERFRAVVDSANEGDETALADVRYMLETSPAPTIAALGGDLAEQAEAILISKITGEQVTVRESLQAKLKMLRAELSGPNPNPIERLLVDRVVACWLQLAHADALVAQAEQVTFTEGDYRQRRQDRAHRRYLSAVKMLAVVRKLALPIRVDLNVAGSIETRPAEQTATISPRWLPVPTEN